MQLKRIVTHFLALLLFFSPAAYAQTDVKAEVKTKTETKNSTTAAKKKSSAKSSKKAAPAKKSPAAKPAKLTPTADGRLTQTGMASYYARKFHGRKTASGEIYDEKLLTAAHRTLAVGTHVRVTNLRNGKSVVVRVNDRGPFTHSRVIDLSKAAAREIGMIQTGTAKVRVETVKFSELNKLAAQTAYNGGNSTADSAKPVEKSQKSPTTARAPSYALKVVLSSEAKAEQLAAQIKQPNRVEQLGKHYEVIIQVASPEERTKLKQYLTQLGQTKIFSYTEQ